MELIICGHIKFTKEASFDEKDLLSNDIVHFAEARGKEFYGGPQNFGFCEFKNLKEKEIFENEFVQFCKARKFIDILEFTKWDDEKEDSIVIKTIAIQQNIDFTETSTTPRLPISTSTTIATETNTTYKSNTTKRSIK